MSLCNSAPIWGRTVVIQYLQANESFGKLLHKEVPVPPISNSNLRAMELRPRVWISSIWASDSEGIPKGYTQGNTGLFQE